MYMYGGMVLCARMAAVCVYACGSRDVCHCMCTHAHTHACTHTARTHTHIHIHAHSTSYFMSSDSENEALEYKQLSAEWYTFQNHSSFHCLYNNIFIYHPHPHAL